MADKFLVVLFTVVGLTIINGAMACAIAIFSPEPARPMQTELFKICCTVFQTGVGAIIGMLSAHAL
jgi:hypothetical protein